ANEKQNRAASDVMSRSIERTSWCKRCRIGRFLPKPRLGMGDSNADARTQGTGRSGKRLAWSVVRGSCGHDRSGTARASIRDRLTPPAVHERAGHGNSAVSTLTSTVPIVVGPGDV